jgi:glycosyltransferase involved in cell wall biosynthesis
MSVVLFHRDFKRFRGGHLKVFHYFQHVRSTPAHEARIRFTPDSVWDETNPWWALGESLAGPEEEVHPDVLFLGGADWRSLSDAQRAAPPAPVLNLIQDFRPLRRDGPLHEFLAHPAIRICVTPEIQRALEEDGSANGPVLTVPIGLDLSLLPPELPRERRDLDCVVLAVKDPELGGEVARRIERKGSRPLLLDRPLAHADLLAALARARVAVLLPLRREGAYLPPLESMALGTAVVTVDCVGNRSFCRDGETCLLPRRSARAIARATLELLRDEEEELAPMLAAGRRQSEAHSLEREREAFLAILDRTPELWQVR